MDLCCVYYFIMINANCAGADEGNDQINQTPGLDKGNTLTLALLRVVRRVVFLTTSLAIVGCVKIRAI